MRPRTLSQRILQEAQAASPVTFVDRLIASNTGQQPALQGDPVYVAEQSCARSIHQASAFIPERLTPEVEAMAADPLHAVAVRAVVTDMGPDRHRRYQLSDATVSVLAQLHSRYPTAGIAEQVEGRGDEITRRAFGELTVGRTSGVLDQAVEVLEF